MISLNKLELEAISNITGYTFNTPILFEEIDNVAIIHGLRNRDKRSIVAKLSHQPLRLEREYHIVQRLFRENSSKKLLCRPLDKITLSNGLIAFIYEDYGQNLLDEYQLVEEGVCRLIDLDTFLNFAIHCCDCLEMIHKHQIIHGEIKLNAFLWPRNQHHSVKIHNFGSGARSLDMSLTSEGWRKTFHRNDVNSLLQMLIHMSPEQTGRTSFQPDHRTDLYSLGITFYIILTRSLPFIHSSPMEIVHNVLNKKLPLVHEVSPNTPKVISIMIEKLANKSPDERYSSAHGLRQDLIECLNQLRLNQEIKPFDLGRYDIASIFTLPNNPCFGRSSELNLINSIIKRTAYMCGPNVKRRQFFSDHSTLLPVLKLDDAFSFKRVHNKKSKIIHRSTEIIAIYGKAGVGKSTLVRNVKQLARDYGYIAVAKFDKRQPTPYGCILRCLSIFLKNILGESTEEIERFSKMLKEQLGAETISQLPTLLVDNVPELSSFLCKRVMTNSEIQVGDCEMEVGEEMKTRFHTAFIEIFQAMVNFKFVTLFLEDLHEADEASIELLNSLVSAKLDFLIILTYRDNELSKQPSTLLANQDAVISFVNIKNLDPSALMELIRVTMHRQEEIDLVLLTPLVDFIHKKTHGNPFYVCQLLTTLEKKNLIYFTWEKRHWEYNLHEIEKALEISESGDVSIEFLVQRLKELPRDGRKFLKWASFIGNSFNYETVKNLMIENDDIDDEDDFEEDSFEEEENEEEEGLMKHKSKFDAINGLQSALQQGFIQPTNNDNFRFTHDRYSQAVTMLASPEHQDNYHLRIVSHFIPKNNVDKFWVADHVKGAIRLIKQYSTKSSYRKVLIQAGDKAFDSGAHQLAFSYYSAALELLSPDPWINGEDSKYTETLHLYTRLAEISWLIDGALTRNYLNTILRHAESPMDRAAAYLIQHRYRWLRTGGNVKSVMILIDCLHDLGIQKIRMDLPQDELEKLYESTKQEVLNLGFENIKKLPVCESRLIRTRFSIIEEICLWAYWTNDMPIMLSTGSHFVSKTLKAGTTPTTGVGFVFFGIAAMQLFKDYEFAEQIGHVGVTLCDSYGGNSETGRARYLYATFLSCWKYPYHRSITMARTATKQALMGGNRVYSSFAHIQTILVSLLCGENIADTLKEAKSYLEAKTISSMGTSTMATTITRAILALQGKTTLTEQGIFEDDDFKEANFIAKTREENINPQFHLFYYFAMKSIILGLYEFDEASVQLSSEQMTLVDSLPTGRLTHIMYFFRCLCLTRLIQQHKRADLEQELLKSREKLADWAKHSHPENLQSHVDCIDAGIASINENHLEAQRLFDSAIQKAKQGRWPLETSLMYHLAGEYYLKLQLRTVAASFIEQAISGYQHIGAYGSANLIKKKHKAFLEGIQPLNLPKATTAVQTDSLQKTLDKRESVGDLSLKELDMICNLNMNSMETSPEEALLTLDIVDLASILKSCQVISSEMNFELLLKQMMGIILENSGADSGVIIVKENTNFFVVGRGSQQDECDIYSKPKLLSEEADSIMTRISQYAIHTQKSLFIVDIQQDSHFSDGSTSQAKSCICTPIIHKSAVVGCIYIEAPIGSLTSRHEIVLRLLSQQIGISVTNALLFKSIQTVTYANVKMIENQKAALEEARRSKEAALHAMKLKADFLANMSHELRTPFSGFYGMISLLSETVLDAEQQDIVLTAKESCETLLKIIDDLLNFSKLEAGKVTLDLGPLVVEEVIADTIEILSSLATRKGLELAYIVDPDVPTTVIADSSRVRQILTNLLGNAIKFTHHGGVVIRCHLDNPFTDSDDDQHEKNQDDYVRLKFEVVDTGIGICPEEQQRLFEPFSQLDGSTTRKYGGTGLGLSICLQLVRLMTGDIGVDSQPEKGSNFWFTVTVNKEKNTACCSKRGQPVILKYLQQNERVLLATSSDLNAKMIKSLLSDFRLAYTPDMYQAVPKALQERHPVLILDLPPTPSGSIIHQIQSVVDDPECELHIILLYTPSTEGHKIAAEATNSGSDRRGRLVKMAKPARRVKLLRLLEIVMSEKRQGTIVPSLTPAIATRMKDYFRQDELELYAKKSVLIAEDNFVARKLLKQQLEKLGFTVEAACDGEEAIELYKQRPPNYFSVAFFDHHMPKCDGVEATKCIRSLEKKTGCRLPIIALTADIQSSAKQICVDAGMDDYLTKPLIPKNLAATLRQLYPSIHQKHYDTPNPSTPSSPASSSFL